jgi:hypothetical protein
LVPSKRIDSSPTINQIARETAPVLSGDPAKRDDLHTARLLRQPVECQSAQWSLARMAVGGKEWRDEN